MRETVFTDSMNELHYLQSLSECTIDFIHYVRNKGKDSENIIQFLHNYTLDKTTI